MDRAEVFAPDRLSPSQRRHSKLSLSPDGSHLYWSYVTLENDANVRKIAYMSQENGVWGSERIAEFQDTPDADSPCYWGNDRLVFHAVRDTGVKVDDFWVVQTTDAGWGEPKALGIGRFQGLIVMPMPSIADNGNIYFNGPFNGGAYELGIYVSRFSDGAYSRPTLLPQTINTQSLEWTPFIAPDESYLIFASSRPGSLGSTDLYITFRQGDGSWREPVNMGEAVNAEKEERFPSVTPDGRILFFMRSVNEEAQYYWIDGAIIEQFRPKNDH